MYFVHGRQNKKQKIYLKYFYNLQDGSGKWVSLDADLELKGNDIVGTKNPTGHSLLIDCRFELPFGK